MGACESLSGMTQPAAARAVLSLALRGKAAAAGVTAAGAAPGGSGRHAAGGAAPACSQETYEDDLGLLKGVAADIKGYFDFGEHRVDAGCCGCDGDWRRSCSPMGSAWGGLGRRAHALMAPAPGPRPAAAVRLRPAVACVAALAMLQRRRRMRGSASRCSTRAPTWAYWRWWGSIWNLCWGERRR